MDVQRDETFELRAQEDLVYVRQQARAWSIELGFSLVEQTKIVTAVSELARNTIEHGKGGTARFRWLVNAGRTGLRLDFEDTGPGIRDLELALRDGYST
ncbi:MAG: anti-sigma regulatory factor, partial [Gammaproteobacteria bacterium]|nr:anti-sigma regulatory factor [Gammaproteobacteria bacterium]